MDKQTYHPQQDVFRLIDGIKQPVTPYRFGQGEAPIKKIQATKEPTAPKGPYIKSIVFDGRTLTTTAINAEGEEITQKLPAVSGNQLEGKRFDYSEEQQKIPNVGPIPEGTYTINPQEIQRPAGMDNLLGKIGRGRFPGGESRWGSGRILIHSSEEQKEKTGRDGFTIHGGNEPGSRGCIDLTEHNDKFLDFVKKYRGQEQKEVPLEVKYPEENKEVVLED